MADTASVPGAPPPPPEVKVRTMRSDLESMAKSGGGMPRFENVKVAGLSETGLPEVEESGQKRSMMGVLVAGAILTVMAAAGYFAYITFFAPPTVAPAPAGPGAAGAAAPSAAQPAGGVSVSPATATQVFDHKSLFKKPVDEILPVALSSGGTVRSASDLQTFGQRVGGALALAKAGASFVEVAVTTADGHGVSAGDILGAAGVVYDQEFLSAHFDKDPTLFAYRDKNGFWLGAVIALKPGENWLFLKNDVAKIETSPSVGSFFLAGAGTPSAKGFVDATVASTTVRMLHFDGTPSADVLYGWSGNYLILSTSQAGFTQALARL